MNKPFPLALKSLFIVITLGMVLSYAKNPVSFLNFASSSNATINYTFVKFENLSSSTPKSSEGFKISIINDASKLFPAFASKGTINTPLGRSTIKIDTPPSYVLEMRLCNGSNCKTTLSNTISDSFVSNGKYRLDIKARHYRTLANICLKDNYAKFSNVNFKNATTFADWNDYFPYDRSQQICDDVSQSAFKNPWTKGFARFNGQVVIRSSNPFDSLSDESGFETHFKEQSFYLAHFCDEAKDCSLYRFFEVTSTTPRGNNKAENLNVWFQGTDGSKIYTYFDPSKLSAAAGVSGCDFNAFSRLPEAFFKDYRNYSPHSFKMPSEANSRWISPLICRGTFNSRNISSSNLLTPDSGDQSGYYFVAVLNNGSTPDGRGVNLINEYYSSNKALCKIKDSECTSQNALCDYSGRAKRMTANSFDGRIFSEGCLVTLEQYLVSKVSNDRLSGGWEMQHLDCKDNLYAYDSDTRGQLARVDEVGAFAQNACTGYK